ncbi:MAG: L,D-transpeptidase family protein [Clostridiales bacterium]|nr:L,D-transpeptidase family protein [Clostridiales bacterium]
MLYGKHGNFFEINAAQPPLLTKAVTDAGTAYDTIAFSQLILVIAHGSSACLRCYIKGDATLWLYRVSLGVMPGFVGKNGVSASKKEGDGCTPAGLFRLVHAFGVKEKPYTKAAYISFTENSYWVVDALSCYNNTWFEGRQNDGWSSAERLADYPREYAYAVIIEYNTAERTPGRGSAVFLHCGNRPTAGCVAIPEPALLNILKWLDPDKSPGILITGT